MAVFSVLRIFQGKKYTFPNKELSMQFTPPFCPNQHCPTHISSENSPILWFKRLGTRPTLCVGPVPKFKCLVCQKGFSSRTFDIDYWIHRPVDYKLIQNLQVSGAGLRQSCRTLGVSLLALFLGQTCMLPCLGLYVSGIVYIFCH